MTVTAVHLAAGTAEAYETLIEDICRSCGPLLDPVSFQFTARYGADGLLREVLVVVHGRQLRLRPGDRLLLDPGQHPDRWSVVAS